MIIMIKYISCSEEIKECDMHEWLSGGASPCQGEGRGFESRLVLFLFLKDFLESLSGFLV